MPWSAKPVRYDLSRLAPMLLLIAMLVLNAQVTAIVAWAVSFVYAAWRFIVRPTRMGVPIPLVRLIAIPLLILFVGFPGFYRNDSAEFAKDCWYFFSPIVYIAFGYYLAERLGNAKQVIQAYCIGGTLVSIVFLVQLYNVRGGLMASTSVEGYRHQFGTGAFQSVIPAVLLCLSRRSGIHLGLLSESRWLRGVIYTIASVAVAASLSRTLIMVFLFGLMVGLRPARLLRSALPITGLLLVGFFLFSGTSSKFDTITDAFFTKVLQSGDEIGIRSYGTLAEINENWRGFESYRALSAYRDFDTEEKFLGGGHGTPVNIGFSMNLGGPVELQELPILHNGYLYLLVKTGAAGILLYALYILCILLDGLSLVRGGSGVERFCGYTYLWSAIAFAMTQAVITGIYNKLELAANLALLGSIAALAVARRNEREELYEVRLEGASDELPMLPWQPGFASHRLGLR